MRRLAAALAIPVIALVVWLAVRHHRAPSDRGAHAPSSVEHSAAQVVGDAPGETVRGAPQAPIAGGSAGPSLASGSSAPSPSLSPPIPPTPQSGSRPAGSPPSLPPGAGSASDDSNAAAGKLTDRTGWSDNTVIKQLNKELMPLASECIDQARARNAGLRGMLAFTMVVAPTENGKVIIASLKPRTDNQISDPELFECIRESSFSLRELKAPHDFDITMPIQPEGSG